MESRQWRPLVEDERAQAYRAVVDDVIVTLECRIDEHAEDSGHYRDWGLPLLYAYLSAHDRDEKLAAKAEALVSRAIDGLADRPTALSLYGGVAGTGWISAHLDQLFRGADVDDEAYEDVDLAVHYACDTAGPAAVYDLISGPVGLGVYLLERQPSTAAVQGLQALARFLEQRKDHGAAGTTWFTPPALIHPENRPLSPDGYYNLGVAHGVPGAIGVLSRMVRSGTEFEGAARMLRESTDWLIEQMPPDRRFPAWIGPGIETKAARLAWCYGSLGLALVLYDAGLALSSREVEDTALDIAEAAASVTDDAGVVDACLCHGSAGNGHLFNRLFQATGRPVFRSAATYWLDVALKQRRPDAGIAGFLTWTPREMGRPRKDPWVADSTFLSGAPGIALALLAAISPVEPKWDRVLLADV